jgi:hypothetical protein
VWTLRRATLRLSLVMAFFVTYGLALVMAFFAALIRAIAVISTLIARGAAAVLFVSSGMLFPRTTIIIAVAVIRLGESACTQNQTQQYCSNQCSYFHDGYSVCVPA